MRWNQIIEAVKAAQEKPDHISEALWWIMRYVSGSLDDEDWDYGEPTHLDINTAVEIAAPYIGNAKSINRPLSRYLLLSKKDADTLVASKVLPAHTRGFQSFTTSSGDEAIEIGREINFHRTKGKVEVLVTVTPPASDVLFGYDDVAASRKPGIADLHGPWADNWGHQGEVFVRIKSPLPCSVLVLKK